MGHHLNWDDWLTAIFGVLAAVLILGTTLLLYRSCKAAQHFKKLEDDHKK